MPPHTDRPILSTGVATASLVVPVLIETAMFLLFAFMTAHPLGALIAVAFTLGVPLQILLTTATLFGLRSNQSNADRARMPKRWLALASAVAIGVYSLALWAFSYSQTADFIMAM